MSRRIILSPDARADIRSAVRWYKVRTIVVPIVKRKSLRKEIDTHVESGSMVYSDALKSYNDLKQRVHSQRYHHAETAR